MTVVENETVSIGPDAENAVGTRLPGPMVNTGSVGSMVVVTTTVVAATELLMVADAKCSR